MESGPACSDGDNSYWIESQGWARFFHSFEVTPGTETLAGITELWGPVT